MIKFEHNKELDNAMRNLILSMMEVDEYLTTVLEYMEKVLTPKKERELIEILKKYNIPYDHLQYDVKLLTENPYFKNIRLDDVNSESVKYERITIKKRTLINMNFHQAMGKYLFHHHPIGYFDEDIHLPALIEGDTVWMSPAVSEITSMDVGIQKGHGKCMTMGLGIGVLPYLWLQKDEVESVTIVEFNKDVIDLFTKYILPQFNTSKKVEVIHGNAIDYFNEEFLNQFDYVYVDFWESNEDGLVSYTKLMEKKVNLPHIDYWIEDSILSDLKYVLVPYLYALYEGRSIADFISSLDHELKPYGKKINKYFKKCTELVLTEDELLHYIQSVEVLREILSQ